MVTAGASAISIDTDKLGVFRRSREPFDELPIDVAERMTQEHPEPDELAFSSSRRLLAGESGDENLSLYAVPMSSAGLAYALGDASMQPQFVTRLRYGHYSVAQEYRVSAGERYAVDIYGVILDGVKQIVVSVGDREYHARLGENGYSLRYQSIGELERVRAIRCVQVDGETTWQEF